MRFPYRPSPFTSLYRTTQVGPGAAGLQSGIVAFNAGTKPRGEGEPSDIAARFLVLVLYFVVAAAAYNGYFTKWQMRDDTPEFSLPAMLDGTAARPFVYRQLLPTIANTAEQLVPASIKTSALDVMFKDDGSTITKINTKDARDPKYTLRYHGVFYLTFALFLAALFLLRALCIRVTGDVLAGTLAPLGFALLFPILQTIGGYFYDFVELLFMAAAVYATLTRRWVTLGLITALATTNKEAFLFYTITLYPLARTRLSAARASLLIAVLVGIALGVYIPVQALYSDNPGLTAQFHLWENLWFYLNPLSLFSLESSYNMIMLKGYNPIMILVIALVMRKAWAGLEGPWRQHVLLAAMINVPLLLLYCAPGEMRNLSLCYVGFAVILSVALSQWIAEVAPRTRVVTRSASHEALSI